MADPRCRHAAVEGPLLGSQIFREALHRSTPQDDRRRSRKERPCDSETCRGSEGT